MKAQGPFVTLLVGVATAGVLVGLSTIAKSDEDARQKKAAAAAAPRVAPSSAAPTPPVESPPLESPPVESPPAEATPSPEAAAPELSPSAPAQAPGNSTRATYAGRVNGGRATVAIAVRDGKAIAYVCDGRRVEAWLKGTALAGKLALTGRGNASLTGTYAPGAATGSVSAGGKKWTFTAPVAKAPSGLYRASANVGNARIVIGWVVFDNGTTRTQVGVLNTDNSTAPAPPLDTTDGSTTVNGTEITAAPIDGATGSGF